MTETQTLLKKIAALRQRLAQAQGLANDVGSAAASLPGGPAAVPLRVHRLEETVAVGAHHHVLLDTSLRQLPEAEMGAGQDTIFPTQFTARASRLLRRGQDLLKRLRCLANDPLMRIDDADPLAVRYRETVAMTDTVLRTVQAFPNAPSAQLRMCQGLEVILGLVGDRLAGLTAVVEQRRRETGWLATLTELLGWLSEGKLPDVKSYVVLAESILTAAQQGMPVRWFITTAQQPARFVAAHSLNVAQIIARLVRQDAEWRSRALDPVLAALVHDAGMVRIPAEVLGQTGPLDDNQRRLVEGHAVAGAELALRLIPTAGWLTEAAAGHHERLDGTGYPAGLRDGQISPLTRLVAVCDVYAALCSLRPHRPAQDPRAAMTDTLLQADQGKLDAHAGEQLLQLSFYPVGTVVELADGAVAVVVATHQGRRDLNTPARPVLALLTDARRQALPAPRHLDLAECDGPSIVRSLPTAERRDLLGQRFLEWV
jgi:HD-GYP domain-containing protein (c-di-GMP phosphodiesterase class II)